MRQRFDRVADSAMDIVAEQRGWLLALQLPVQFCCSCSASPARVVVLFLAAGPMLSLSHTASPPTVLAQYVHDALGDTDEPLSPNSWV